MAAGCMGLQAYVVLLEWGEDEDNTSLKACATWRSQTRRQEADVPFQIAPHVPLSHNYCKELHMRLLNLAICLAAAAGILCGNEQVTATGRVVDGDGKPVEHA